MDNTINPYQVLGVPDRSDLKTCQAAYRKLALLYHPDRSKKLKDKEKMVLINKCWDFLKDSEKKAKLDTVNQTFYQNPIVWTYRTNDSPGTYTVKFTHTSYNNYASTDKG